MTWPCMFSDLKCVGPITMRKSLLTIILTSLAVFPEIHRRRSSVNFRGHQIFARKICIKNQQNARILLILARKIIKIPKFLYLPEKFTKFPNFAWFLPEKYPNLRNNCPKNIFSRILGGHVPPLAPVSYAYAEIIREGDDVAITACTRHLVHRCRSRQQCHGARRLRKFT